MKRSIISIAVLGSALVASTLVSSSAEALPPSSAEQPYRLRYGIFPQLVDMSPTGLAAVSAHVQNSVNQGAMDGAVLLVARHGKVVLHQAFGKRDGNWTGSPTENPPMPLDGIFDVQSITKLFTAFVAMKQNAEGQLDFEAPVADYLSQYSSGTRSGILVKDLVRFSSGLTIDIDSTVATDPWEAMLTTNPDYDPGTTVLYSDLAYRVLGRVVETVGNASLDELVETYITDPLQMRDTDWRPAVNMPQKQLRFVGTDYSLLRNADGSPHYMRGEVADEQDYWLEETTGQVTGCDGAFSTAWDLALFGQMMLNRGARVGGRATGWDFCIPGFPFCSVQTVLPVSHTENMMALQTKDNVGVPFGSVGASSTWLNDLLFANKGYGWELADTEPGAHSVTGSFSSASAVSKIGGAGTFLVVDPDPSRDLVIVLLTNHGLPSFVGADGFNVDAQGNLIWPGYENMLNGIAPDAVSNLVYQAITTGQGN